MDIYIDLAFNEVFNSKTLLNKVAIANAYDSFDSELKLITMELINNKISPIEFEQEQLIKYREESVKSKESKNGN